MNINDLEDKISNILKEIPNVEFYFNGCITSDDFISQIIFEIIKEEFYGNLNMSSMRNHVNDTLVNKNLPETNYDSCYEQLKRNRRQAEKENEKLLSCIGLSAPLDNNEMDTIQDKLSGYQYNSLQFLQIDNYSNLEIVRTLSTQKMHSSKKISRNKFREIFDQYDNYVQNQIHCSESYHDTIFNAIDFYDLQCRMMIELIYLFACEMEKNNTKEFPKNASYIFGFYGEIDNNIIHLQNRFILQQHLFIPFAFYDNSQSILEFDRLYCLLLLKKDIMQFLKQHMNKFQSDEREMSEFIKNTYNPFSTFCASKEWTDKRIDLSRSVIATMWGT